jgi:hypothetical protein
LQALILAAILSTPDAVYIRHEALLRLASDTSFVEVTEESLIPLTSMGVARYSVLSVPYTRGSDSVSIEQADLRPARPGRAASRALVTERPRAGLSAAGRLEGSFREYVLEFGGLETGDTILIRMSRRVSRLPMAPVVDYTFFFQGRDSIACSRFRLEWPSAIPLHIWSSSCPEPLERSAGGIRYLEWETGPAAPVDVLPFSVPVDEVCSRVAVSSAAPEQVSRMLFGSLDPGPVDGVTAASLDSILAFTDGSPEDLSAFVSSAITYLGAEIGADPGYTPQPVQVTLARRSGVCRDMATLLVALLRRAGVEAWTVLCRTSPRLDALVGSRSFDHMIVMAVDDGDTCWLDPSGPASGGGTGLRGLRVLPLTPAGCGMLELPDPTGSDTLSISLRATLSEGLDTLSADFLATFSLGAEDLWRGMMSSVPEQDRPEVLRLLFGALPGSRLDLEGDPDDHSSRLSVRGTALYAVPAVNSGNGFDLCIPGLDEIDQAGTRMAAILLAGGRDAARMHIETPLSERLAIELEIPGAILALPAEVREENYGCLWTGVGDSASGTEWAVISPVWPDAGQASSIEAALLIRGSPGNRVLHVLGIAGP